jgi:uncharacterized protein with HEPN domain
MKSDLPLLGHIADSIAAIESYTTAGRDAFLADRFIAFRNRLIHAYWSVDLPLVWSVIENDLPPLKAEVSRLRAQSSGGGAPPTP